MKPIIDVDHLSKKYSRHTNRHLRYGIYDLLAEIFGRNASVTLRPDEFLAVDNVSLRLYPGDSLALIGRNGAGKSTLLKMLNGMIKPDAGRIAVTGRVQALINLGAGFNPALSGLDNIYNSAAIYGFSRRETAALVEEIIAFSELDDAIESPLQTYSSGMKARLGFAVAVHLKPDILLIDEVLSVGDYAFQNKCFARIEEIKRKGVTIVFVSHSHNNVVKLCENAIWLHQGVVMRHGPALDAVEAYLAFLEAEEKEKTARKTPAAETAKAPAPPKKTAADGLYGPVYPQMDQVDEISCEAWVNGQPVKTIPIHSEVLFKVSFRLKRDVAHLCSTLNFYRKDGLLAAAIASIADQRFRGIHRGRIAYEVRIPDFPLTPGRYVIMMPIADGQQYLWRDIAMEFLVEGAGKMHFGVLDLTHEYRVAVKDDPETGSASVIRRKKT